MSQVLTIRCTRKLLKRLAVGVPSEPTSSTNRLGDWYANLLFTKRARLIICISERSLLPVLVEATDPFSFIPRFQEAVRSVLQRIGATSEVLGCEAREMGQNCQFSADSTTITFAYEFLVRTGFARL